MSLLDKVGITIHISDLPGEKDSIHKLLRAYYYRGHTRRGCLRYLWRNYVQPYVLPWRCGLQYLRDSRPIGTTYKRVGILTNWRMSADFPMIFRMCGRLRGSLSLPKARLNAGSEVDNEDTRK